MKQADYIRLTAQIAVLKEIAVDYSGKTIDNIIQQLEAIKKEVENDYSRRIPLFALRKAVSYGERLRKT